MPANKTKFNPVFVAFGPFDAWFVRYDNGTYAWQGLPQSLAEAIQRAKNHYKVGIYLRLQ